MACVGAAYTCVEEVVGETRELVAQGRVEGVQMHAQGVLVYLRPSLGQSRHHRDTNTGSEIAEQVYHAGNLIVLSRRNVEIRQRVNRNEHESNSQTLEEIVERIGAETSLQVEP